MMRKIYLAGLALLSLNCLSAQTNPTITNWMINNSNTTGRYYTEGNSVVQTTSLVANVQTVEYSADYVYVQSSGIPTYVMGPFLDGNPSEGSDNENIFMLPLSGEKNLGTLTETPSGAIGIFINGVPMYDYKDGQSYKSSTGTDDGQGDGVWNRNAILAEKDGFDCSKGHPSPIFQGMGPQATLVGGTYHHHQNPTAFNLDKVEVSDICDMYAADGLYTLNASEHSPLIGYAFDGFPVYGAYGYDGVDGSGEIVLIKSSYQESESLVRSNGPAVSIDFPIGWYKEDYDYIANSGHLDEHNGRFCVTPEYPDGTYAYFATVDDNWNSTYPYIVGPEYYGVVSGGNVDNISEEVTSYTTATALSTSKQLDVDIVVFPNPAADLVAIQAQGILKTNLNVMLYDLSGNLVKETIIFQGSTIWHLDTQTVYDGEYILHISDGVGTVTRKIIINKQ